MADMPKDVLKAKKMVDRVAADLGEHFDSVRIFVTWPTDDNISRTLSYVGGYGNYYASKGVVLTWLDMESEEDKEFQRKKTQEEQS